MVSHPETGTSGTGSIYTRNSNPTVNVFEEKVRLLEDAEAATSAASGMGIIVQPCCLWPRATGSYRSRHLRRNQCDIH
ncbi:MAG: PLP-dependent transferase [Verrucomicrobiales bacterium]|nr:PLP-dependent transferase [Verrucomicrobiales bacterium]